VVSDSRICRVQGDVDATRLRGHGIGVLADRPLVERIDLSGFGHSPGRADIPGDRVELGQRATGEEDCRPFAREGAGHRAADRPSGS